MEILTNFLYQIFFALVVVVVLGLLIALCRRAFCALVGRNGPKILLITGVIGTPIHELSHALMCLIFGHKITEIKLYNPKSDDGTLGYVNHTYNKRNIYHQIGNFFIGIAPILCGSGVLLLLMYLLIPDTSATVLAEIKEIGLSNNDVGAYFGAFWKIITSLFNFSNMGDYRWWIFIVLALLISSHMELSLADIKGSLSGLAFILAIFLVMDVILYFVAPSALQTVTSAMAYFSSYVAGFLAISGIFSILMVLIALIIRLIVMIVKR